MKLTDNEIRDIHRHLESGKPLPEKYRFLLFKDKKEVELVWNGKSNEVCNVTLPFQIIEQVDEPRSEEHQRMQMSLFDLQGGRQVQGWSNDPVQLLPGKKGRATGGGGTGQSAGHPFICGKNYSGAPPETYHQVVCL